ncbi:hypothetical protein HZS_3840, partial [Henneguya salminicola]
MQFQDQKYKEMIKKRYQNFGTDLNILEENKTLTDDQTNLKFLKCFNVESFVGDQILYSDQSETNSYNFCIKEIQRYRDVILNHVSYIILLIGKHLKYNKSYQYLSFIRKLQKSRLMDLFLHYIHDIGHINICTDFMSILHDFKAQKILYYGPKIYTFFISVPSIFKLNLEYDKVFARDRENYGVGIEYYKYLQKDAELQIISKYPNPWKMPQNESASTLTFSQ